MRNTSERGFTLIELLVVIAIIGLLSSVVLASLAQARNRARDATIQQQVGELGKLFELQFLESKNYSGLSVSVATATTEATCPNLFVNSSPYYARAVEICRSIIRSQINSGYSGYVLARGNTGITVNGVPVTPGSRFAVMARSVNPAPGTSQFYCLGSSGNRSKTNSGVWTSPGCHLNP